MDVGFWIGAAVGFVTFAVCLFLAIKEKREGDPDWKWNALVAIVGLVGTIVSVQQGLAAAKESVATSQRISEAHAELEKERAARVAFEDALAPRTIEITESAKSLAQYKGIETLIMSAPDREAEATATQIESLLETAGWKRPIRGRRAMSLGTFDDPLFRSEGIRIECGAGGEGDRSCDAARELARQLRTKSKVMAEQEFAPQAIKMPPNTIQIFVGLLPTTFFRDRLEPGRKEERERIDGMRQQIEDTQFQPPDIKPDDKQ